jgi:hypothetical protein
LWAARAVWWMTIWLSSRRGVVIPDRWSHRCLSCTVARIGLCPIRTGSGWCATAARRTCGCVRTRGTSRCSAGGAVALDWLGEHANRG